MKNSLLSKSKNLLSYSAEVFTLCSDCIELCTAYLGDDFQNNWPEWASTSDELRIDDLVTMEAPQGFTVFHGRSEQKLSSSCLSCEAPHNLSLCIGLHDSLEGSHMTAEKLMDFDAENNR